MEWQVRKLVTNINYQLYSPFIDLCSTLTAHTLHVTGSTWVTVLVRIRHTLGIDLMHITSRARDFRREWQKQLLNVLHAC